MSLGAGRQRGPAGTGTTVHEVPSWCSTSACASLRRPTAQASFGGERRRPLGSGQVAKTVNNLIHWGQISAITEALRLGEAYGLDVPSVRRALMDGPAGMDLRVARVSRAVMAATPLADVLRLLRTTERP